MAWLYVPRNGTLASTAAEEGLTSESTERCQTLAASATWRSKRLPLARWLRLWKQEPWMRRLCTAMPSPSTADASVDGWLASLEEAPVRSSPRPTRSGSLLPRSGLPPSEEVSSTDSSRLPMSAGPNGSSGRTSAGQLPLFPCAWTGSKRGVGAAHGRAFMHLPWEGATSGSASSCWPTATARDWVGSCHSDEIWERGGRPLNEWTWRWARTHPDLMTLLPGGASYGDSRSWRRHSHNPFFVAWLMGWTWWLEAWDGSTFSASLGMESSPTKQPQPSDSSGPTVSVKNEAA